MKVHPEFIPGVVGDGGSYRPDQILANWSPGQSFLGMLHGILPNPVLKLRGVVKVKRYVDSDQDDDDDEDAVANTVFSQTFRSQFEFRLIGRFSLEFHPIFLVLLHKYLLRSSRKTMICGFTDVINAVNWPLKLQLGEPLKTPGLEPLRDKKLLVYIKYMKVEWSQEKSLLNKAVLASTTMTFVQKLYNRESTKDFTLEAEDGTGTKCHSLLLEGK